MRGFSGGERVELRIRDATAAVWTLSTAWQTSTYRHTAAVNIQDVKVAFVNDNDAPNLDVAVESVSVDGLVYPTQAPDTYSVGSWSASSGCDGGFKNSMMLNCNGYFQFKVGTAAPSPTSATASVVPNTPRASTAAPRPPGGSRPRIGTFRNYQSVDTGSNNVVDYERWLGRPVDLVLEFQATQPNNPPAGEGSSWRLAWPFYMQGYYTPARMGSRRLVLGYAHHVACVTFCSCMF